MARWLNINNKESTNLRYYKGAMNPNNLFAFGAGPELFIFQKTESDPDLKFSISVPIFLKFGIFWKFG